MPRTCFGGNLIKDQNKGITEIVYNHLNLPKKITFDNNEFDGTIEYLYDANGIKLRKIVTDNTTSPATMITTHYLDGFQYSEDKMDFFPTAEGYVNVTWASGTPGGPQLANYNYVYNYSDHLGNIRLRYTKNPGTGGGLRILEEDHYYPFGLKHQGYNNEHNIFEPGMPGGEPVVIVPVNPLIGDKYKYKFNGMEWQNELDLNFYDFGMRNYDPALGRWMNIDPLAEVSRRWSPYTYAYNNPVYFIDPDGMMAVSGSNLIKPNMLETASYERYVFWDGGGNSGGNDSGNGGDLGGEKPSPRPGIGSNKQDGTSTSKPLGDKNLDAAGKVSTFAGTVATGVENRADYHSKNYKANYGTKDISASEKTTQTRNSMRNTKQWAGRVSKGTSIISGGIGVYKFLESDKSWGDYGQLIVSVGSSAATFFPATSGAGIIVSWADNAGVFDDFYQFLDTYEQIYDSGGTILVPIGPIIIPLKKE